jgi:RNase P/RNase MRP subunit p30|tara:strand:- start:3443 stop:3787 length:345 start_codon:yes stop_codon:yes gene_type:complete
MTFFDSDVVRAEIVHINELQEKLYNKMFSFYTMNKQDKLDHVELLKTLIDKQKVLYARLSLSDDPEAKKMKEHIAKSAVMLGMPPDMDMNLIFSNMEKLVEHMKDQVEKKGNID